MNDNHRLDDDLHELFSSVEFQPRDTYKSWLHRHLKIKLKHQRANGYHGTLPNESHEFWQRWIPGSTRRKSGSTRLANVFSMVLTLFLIAGFSVTVYVLWTTNDTNTVEGGIAEQVCTNAEAHSLIRQGVEKLPDGRLPITASNVTQISYLMTLNGTPTWIETLAISPANKMLIVGDVHTLLGKSAYLWCIDDQQEVDMFDFWVPGNFEFMSDDGQVAITSTNELLLWDIGQGDAARSLDSYGEIHALDIHPFTNWIVFASTTEAKQHTIQLWDPASEQVLLSLEESEKVVDLVLSQDARIIAAQLHDNTIHLWDVDTGQEIALIDPDTGKISGLAFAPDSHMLAFGTMNGDIQLWDAGRGAFLMNLSGHSNEATDVTFSPDGSLIATTSYDGTVRLWDAANGDLLQTLSVESSSQYVTSRTISVIFSDDGTLLLAGTADGGVWMWGVLA